MRRYLGRATGRRRKPKTHPWFWTGAFVLTAFGLLVMYVLIFNPGASRSPDDPKGSVSPSLVMPDSTDGGTTSG